MSRTIMLVVIDHHLMQHILCEKELLCSSRQLKHHLRDSCTFVSFRIYDFSSHVFASCSGTRLGAREDKAKLLSVIIHDPRVPVIVSNPSDHQSNSTRRLTRATT